FFGGHHATNHAAHADAASVPRALDLDEIIARARAAGLRGPIDLRPSPHGGPVNLHDDHPRTAQEVWMQLDGRTGDVLIRATWADYPLLAKLVAGGIDLHEGRFFGRINQIF